MRVRENQRAEGKAKPQLTAKEILEIERSIINDERKNDEMIVRFRELRDTARSRYVTLSLAIGAVVVPVTSATTGTLDRYALRQVVVMLTAAVVVALLGGVAESLASVRRARLAFPKEQAALRQLVAWAQSGASLPPDKETADRRAADARFQQALGVEAKIYGISDALTVALITAAMLRFASVFIWAQ